jgi:two-component system phosphate regulon sensor histidine kinase PhoR
MPLAAGVAIMALLVVLGQLGSVPALGAIILLLAAAALWPLDTSVFVEPLATSVASANRVRDLDRNGWRAVIDAVPAAVLALDGAGCVVHHNRLITELFPKIRVGQTMSQITRNPDLIGAIDSALASDDRVDVELIERVPVERRVSVTVSRVARTAALSAPFLLITFRDLTEQDRLAQMRADFIANASHELRTPLASLRGFVETLQGPAREDPSARERFLPLMASQTVRMTRLIDDLLSLSRVEMRVHLPPRGIVELNEAAAYVCQSLEPLIDATKAEITLDRYESPARIRGAREEIVQVIQNLVQNAIKYGREDGRIQVRVGRDPPKGALPAKVWVSVTDDGPGIAREHLPRLTERFYRVNVASSREKGGTGLGLAIVKHILNRHRAEMKIASKLGGGSTFSVTFDELGMGS